MSAPVYSQVPPADFQTIYTSYPSPPQSSENKQFYSHVEECSPPPTPNGQLTSATPQSARERGIFWLRSVAHKFWLLEACASLLSLALFGAILGVMLWYHDREYGDASSSRANMEKRPSIFPIIAILSALMRAAMLLSVATAIGQLKWRWFRTGRRLLDMERFDEAARGILGSARLMWTVRFGNVATVGAALTILALPLDAIIQSAVLIPSKTMADGMFTTSMPRSTWYTEHQIMESPDKLYPETALMNAIRFGQSYGNGLMELFDPTAIVDCPTGICNYHKAQTLAIHSKCVDRTEYIDNSTSDDGLTEYKSLKDTDLVFYHDGTDEYDSQIIATNSSINASDEYLNKTFGSGFLGLIATTAIMLQGPVDILAYECVLSWTVHTMTEYLNETSNFALNATFEDVVLDFVYNEDNKTDVRWNIEPEECFVQGKRIPRNGTSKYYVDNCISSVGLDAGKSLENMLLDPQDGFVGKSLLINAEKKEFNKLNTFVTNIDAARTGRGMDPLNDTQEIFRNIESMWENIAYAASSIVRHRESRMEGSGDKVQLITNGTVYRTIYYYDIEWTRLAIPGFIVGFAALFVLYTAILTRREYAWRRSALPLLFHGIHEHNQNAFRDSHSLVVMEGVAEKMHVKLETHGDTNSPRFTTQC